LPWLSPRLFAFVPLTGWFSTHRFSGTSEWNKGKDRT
jgi:hypothetical protein